MSRVVVFIKRIALVAALTLAAAVAYAQEVKSVDVVYLKNGSIVRGTLLEYTTGKGLKIQTADGSVFVYTDSEVERIAREFPEAKVAKPAAVKQPEEEEEDRVLVNNGYSRKKGLHVFFEAALGGGVVSSKGGGLAGLFTGTTPALSVGYQANPWVYIGGGFAINNHIIIMYNIDNAYHFGMPFFLDSRFDIGRRHSFYVDTRLGGAALFADGDKGGFYLAQTLGVRFALPGGTGLNLGLGYEEIIGGEITYKSSYAGYKFSGAFKSTLSAFMFRFTADF